MIRMKILVFGLASPVVNGIDNPASASIINFDDIDPSGEQLFSFTFSGIGKLQTQSALRRDQ